MSCGCRTIGARSTTAKWASSTLGTKTNFAGKLSLCRLVAEQSPLIIYHGDVGTGKTVTAECVANRLVAESRAEDSVLFKLGNRVRGAGKVGEMGTLLVDAFDHAIKTAGKHRRATLIIDEGDSLAADRAQNQSHHEDKVAVNTLIQRIDSRPWTEATSSAMSKALRPHKAPDHDALHDALFQAGLCRLIRKRGIPRTMAYSLSVANTGTDKWHLSNPELPAAAPVLRLRI